MKKSEMNVAVQKWHNARHVDAMQHCTEICRLAYSWSYGDRYEYGGLSSGYRDDEALWDKEVTALRAENARLREELAK